MVLQIFFATLIIKKARPAVIFNYANLQSRFAA